MKKKNPIIIALISVVSVVLVVLSAFLIRCIVANVNIKKIANEKGEKFGVTDFKSDSAEFTGEVKNVLLKSETFASLSDEDRFQLILSIITDEEMIALTADVVQDELNPLLDQFQIYSGDKYHSFSLNANTNMIVVYGGKDKYYVEDAESYGFKLPFANQYGTEETPCIVSGCEKNIVRTGNSNACWYHAGICDDCHTYINKGDDRCDRCAKAAFDKVYDDVVEVLGEPW